MGEEELQKLIGKLPVKEPSKQFTDDLFDTIERKADVMYGNFLSTIIDFAVVAAVVYYGVKKLGLDKLDKKKKVA